MHRVALLGLLLTTTVLAGCTDDAAPLDQAPAGRTSGGTALFTETTGSDRDAGDNTRDLQGVVVDYTFRPLEGALVTLRDGTNTTSDAAGAFAFSGVAPIVHILNVTHASGATTVTVDATREPRPIVAVLSPPATTEPYTVTEQHRGHLQCAAEALIISGSCDTILDWGNDNLQGGGAPRAFPEPLDRQDNITIVTANGWATLVIDVIWDAQAYPGLDGLRVVSQGPGARDDLTTYDKYRSEHEPDGRVTYHITPGAAYESGVISVPDQGTAIDIRVLPHSYGYHAACDPRPDGQCFLGAGAGTDVAFQLLATTFYVDPAPAGWSHA